MSDFRERYGPWAVVTGASTGIGAAFAEALAARGLHLVLVAHRRAQLEELREKIAQWRSVEVIALPLDLSQEGCCESLIAACKDLETGLVVNNAGTGIPGPFGMSDIEREKQVMRLNCITPVV